MNRIPRVVWLFFGFLLSLSTAVWAGTASNMYYWDGVSSWLPWPGTVTTTPSGTQDVNVIKYGGTSTTLGQKASSASIPVVLPSDQSAIPVTTSAPATASILDGYQTFTGTTGATTLITITAGKTWTGSIGANVACQGTSATACQARAVFTTVGAGTTPAAGTWYACEAKFGASAAAGAGGGNSTPCVTQDFAVACASGTCTVAVATTQAGTASVVDAFAHGKQQ